MDKLGVNCERLILPHEPYFCQEPAFTLLKRARPQNVSFFNASRKDLLMIIVC